MTARALALALVVLVTGCGGGSGGGERAAYIQAAEAICAKANSDQKALKAPDVAHLVPYVTKVVAIADDATTKLLALDAPKNDEKQLHAKLLDPLRRQVARGHAFASQVAQAQKKNDQAALFRLFSNPPTQTLADLRWMKGYGFKACVDAADTSS